MSFGKSVQSFRLFNFSLKEKHKVMLLFGIAFVARLIALPYSQDTEADATARVMLAEWAKNHGGELSSLQWPALHIYFLTLGQLIFGDRVFGPVFLTMLIGAASVIPFYFLTRNLFNKQGAFLSALLFTFSPLVFRNSFLTLSEIYHVFFSLLAMWTFSIGVQTQKKKLLLAFLAGLFTTIACGGRFEPWVLSLLLGLILLLQREWKMFFVYGIVSGIFPLIWMIFCSAKTGDPLVSFEMVRHQNLDIGKINDNLDAVSIMGRKIFFPISWFISVFPIVAIVILGMFPRLIREWKTNRLRLYFSGLFLFFVAFFISQSLAGTLANQHRYTITLVMLSMPIFSLWFENGFGKWAWKGILSMLMVVAMIPWSFSWYRFPIYLLSFWNGNASAAICKMVPTTYREIFAVPQLQNQELVGITKKIKEEIKPNEGLIIDFWDWNGTYFITQQSPENVHLYCVPYGDSHKGDNGWMVSFLNGHLTGMIMLSDYSSLSKEITLQGNVMELDSVPGGLLLKPESNSSHYRLFRYTYLPPDALAIEKQKQLGATPIFFNRKDIAYYEYCISTNTEWMATIWRNSFRKQVDIQSQIRIDAENEIKKEEAKVKALK